MTDRLGRINALVREYSHALREAGKHFRRAEQLDGIHRELQAIRQELTEIRRFLDDGW